MTSLRFVARMAWRESRAAPRRLLLFTSTISLGVGALMAINSFTDNLKQSVDDQGRALLGADLALSSGSRFTTAAEAFIDSLACAAVPPCGSSTPPGNLARVTSFSAMAYVPRTSGARLVEVVAVRGGYPFYGEIKTAPSGLWTGLQNEHQVLVDPALLTALDARAGDTLALGDSRFTIAGAVLNFPGDVGVRAAFGPRVFLPAAYLDETGLLSFGSRARYEAYLKLPPGIDPTSLANRFRDRLRAERAVLRTASEDQRDLKESLEQLGRYLGLVALIALLLGGLGVGSAVQVFIKQKRETIAALRCLGATARQVFLIYLTQALALGLIGSLVGVALGTLLQLGLPSLLGDFLPVDVAVTPSRRAMVIGLGVGLWVAFAFTLLPLLAVRRVPPLAVLREPFESTRHPRRDPWRWPAALILALSVAGLAALQVGSLREGSIFAAAVGAVLCILWLAALGLIKGLRRWFPHGLPYIWRQGLANLYRPANQTVTVVLALGFGTFLLGTLFLVQRNLLRDIRLEGRGQRPNLVFFDIQPDQWKGVEAAIREAGLPVTPPVPVVPMRMVAVKDRPVTEILSDTTLRGPDGERLGKWAFRREYRSTYRDTLVGSERLIAGRWEDGAHGQAVDTTGAPIPISIEVGVASELAVTIGDEIVWDIQGIPLRTKITSMREVNWARFEPNFFVVFPEGPLSGAPQMLVTLTRVEDPAQRGHFQRIIAERFPNVTSIDLSLVQQVVERIASRVTLAIRFMAAFSLATGAVVLIGALATSRFQRVREGVLLRTLGASRGQVLRVIFAEYACLGLLAGIVAIGLSSVAGWALMKWIFEIRFTIPWAPLLGLGLGLVAITVVVGFWNSTEVIRKTPLAVLRAE